MPDRTMSVTAHSLFSNHKQRKERIVMSVESALDRAASKHMLHLINDLSDNVRKKLDDAAYDVMETYYAEFKPRYYKRTRNFKYGAYSNAKVSQNISHKKGHYGKTISIEFSPNEMKDVYYQTQWDGHKYQLTNNPVPKEHIFESSFIYGFHGLPYEAGDNSTSLMSFINDDIYTQNKSPYDNMKKETDKIVRWLQRSKYVDHKIEDFFQKFQNEAIDILASSMSEKL